MRIATLAVGFPLFATIANALIMGSRHFFLSEWPVHAYHHLACQIILDSGISLLGLALLHRFTRGTRERWIFWSLFLVGASVFGGYWLSSLILGLGEPNALAYGARVAYTASFAVGLAMLWRELPSEPSP